MCPFSVPLALNLQQEKKTKTSEQAQNQPDLWFSCCSVFPSTAAVPLPQVSCKQDESKMTFVSSDLALTAEFQRRGSPFFVLLNSTDKKMGAANDYHTFNLQLAKERSCLITSYNVHQPVLHALRYVWLHWENNYVS